MSEFHQRYSADSQRHVRHIASFVVSAVLATAAFVAISCTPYPLYHGRGDVGQPSIEPRAAESPQGEETGGPAEDPNGTRGRSTGRTSEPANRPSAIDAKLLGRIVATYVGTPYLRGGDNLQGIDCSNLVAAIYRDYDGSVVPASTRALYREGELIEGNQLHPGDLVFFNFTEARSPSHVGLYLGDNHFVHSAESTGVTISSLGERAFQDAYQGARRITPELRSEE